MAARQNPPPLNPTPNGRADTMRGPLPPSIAGDAATAPGVTWMLPATPSSIRPARQQTSDWLAAAGASTAESRDAALVVSELFTNAVRASKPQDRVRVELASTAAGWAISVADLGEVFSPLTRDAAHGPLAVGGRGLHVVSSVAGPVTVHRDPQGWTVVRAVLPAAPGAGAAHDHGPGIT